MDCHARKGMPRKNEFAKLAQSKYLCASFRQALQVSSAMDDKQLISAIKRRDQQALLELYQRYADYVFSIAYRVLDDQASAEECLQDVFLRIWQRIDQYDEERGVFATWLARVTRNMAIDRLRQTTRRVKLADSLLSDETQATMDFLSEWADRERAENLRAMIERLPAEQVQVIALSYYGGMTQAEIAEHLNLPLGTVKTRMRAALQKLREAWNASEDR
ncbi:MAG: sigma-70 family RNA polymerase sigma factor [Chloroflexota bacterium]|uniref:RNA polymerase subunit sigma-24 n=1 Tax=Candidatus Thermofonsia Clade 1 bacterium TaxID=2364210 RepID=A0A2M8Q0C7_9CHLR|nr:MAG: RNA polymerase subunit sigma-24 [Candidatus Thermofonsia Clade 1 bacterium]RMF53196.1 MAG: sigma-70 family RNA polymerase sigma factor [Chloroflexota bacterium]